MVPTTIILFWYIHPIYHPQLHLNRPKKMKGFTQVIAVGCLLNAVSAFTGPFVPKSSAAGISVPKTKSSSSTTALKMVDCKFLCTEALIGFVIFRLIF